MTAHTIYGVQDHVQAECHVQLKVDFGQYIAKHCQVLAKYCQSPNQISSSLAQHHFLNFNNVPPSVYREHTCCLSQPTPLLH